MLHQIFEISDIPRVGALAFIEMALSVDNAIVLGVLVHALPALARKKALYIGLISAFFLRAIALFFASFILRSHWLEVLGGIYLIYLGLHYFIRTKNPAKIVTCRRSFWKTVIMVELFDLVFAIDSIIAGVAFIAGNGQTIYGIHPKLWIVYVGGMLGVIGVRYAADLFSHFIERFPNLAKSGHLLIAWIGVKLCINVFAPHLTGFEIIFWILFVMILSAGFWRKKLQ